MSTTEKKRKFIIDVLYVALILAIGYLVLQYALPLLAPFVVAFVVAYLLRRPIRFLARILHVPKSLVAVLLVLLTYGLVGFVLTLAGIRVTATIGELVDQIPGFYSSYVLPTLSSLTIWLEDLLAGADPMVLSALNEMQNQLIQAGFQCLRVADHLGLLHGGVSAGAADPDLADGDLQLFYRH